ncbi:hepcidin-1 isoform X1 [Heptranchias perlo]|uniref:hepcidin-1 isoform X1 n=1 Tax=Heptranchias perlo TaxID=212740 RepID=UPI0035595829
MRSSQMKVCLVLLSLVLLACVHVNQCLSLSKIETEHDSLTNEEAVDPPATGSLLLREKRWTHVPICLYCCGCCNKKGARITCGFCCKL